MNTPPLLRLTLAFTLPLCAATAKTFEGTPKKDKLVGTPLKDTFIGHGGNDLIIGGEDVLTIGGTDTARGGSGNDTYQIFGDPGQFKIIEDRNEGNDWWIPAGRVGPRQVAQNVYKNSPWVETTASGDQRVVLRLPAHVENLKSWVWNGAPSENAPTAIYLKTEIHGNDAANTLTSDDRNTAPDDWIRAAISEDRIYGYGGDDTFRYSQGRDDYFGGEGWDTLDLRLTKVSRLINAEPELLVDFAGKRLVYGAIRSGNWTGWESTFQDIEAVILSEGVDHVRGSSQSEFFIIDRGDRAGGDRIWAGDGNDTLVIKRDFAGHQHIFYFGETGFDLLDLSDFRLPVTIDLASTARQPLPTAEGANAQGLELMAIEGVYSGNKSDTLGGNSALTEVFRPGLGNDTIRGDNTPLAPYTNVDYIYFDTPLDPERNVDTILDVKTETDGSKRLEDILYLDTRIFKDLLESRPNGAAYLEAKRFRKLTARSTLDADDRILVDEAKGRIYYDPDGKGPKARKLFAKVTPGIAVASTNFATY